MCPTSGNFCFVFYTLNRVRSGIGDIEGKKPPTACMLRMPGFPSAFEETNVSSPDKASVGFCHPNYRSSTVVGN
ncbi:hypothetical protein TWF225_007662 [Orbilia oligospora]|uniref:Uncharacterized protein n=1 Tax=Orbilia oligospora TaxID=2813651 RepID=A0A8H2HMC7_ORBOL|nr:hypothetical protein TWF225_007662 [Orbilia oligospora]KAF3296957.1 hypothetical protein TWF132_009447 [Orbilia oligospora]TGJ64276.1 hypothetical protein EYR41_010339 [Orbilia oligospora]